MAQRLPTPYRDESEVVSQHLNFLADVLDAEKWTAVTETATPWVQAVRDHPPPFWAMETLLKEYPISSAEGLALMRLAEALLRVPDAETAIALTADQLSRADFESSGDSTLSRLSSSAIALSKHFLPPTALASSAQEPPGMMIKLGAKSVVGATLRAVQLLGRQFVLGQTIQEAQRTAAITRKNDGGERLSYSYDMLGEGARTMVDADKYFQSYKVALQSIAVELRSSASENSVQHNDGISIKLSALHPRYEFGQHARVMRELVPRVFELCKLAALANINLTIDAEEVDRLELSIDVFEALLKRIADSFPTWQGFGLALQAYQSRSLELIQHVAQLGRKYQVKLMCRLVKGAYWDAEIKRAQEAGLAHYPVFTHKQHTDISYLACARALLASADVIYPQFATHNAATIAAICAMAKQTGSPFELQRLHGMGEGIYREVLRDKSLRCRVYAPVGAHKDLLAYLVRRLLENGANSSFVHQLASDTVSVETLLKSPLVLQKTETLPLPPNLYGAVRSNSQGIDLAVESMRTPCFSAFEKCVVPVVATFAVATADASFTRANVAFQTWTHRPVSARAEILRNAADRMQAQMPELTCLLVKEAYKTWADAISEVREAVDFLRYYANEAERIMVPIALPGPTGESNLLRLRARGVWVCISPWNFPLAIFIGQMAAALATGNTVLAKPAEQTPAIAQAAVNILRAAGLPNDALQLCHGPGETVGARLVTLPSIAGVVFTGSTQVARLINRALADREGAIIPLIAETGGINAMVVDSSALPEQVCDAVIQSAFRSAGQRCSALRLLCVHDAIADHVIAMIRGAMKELVCGESSNLATDVPRLIDAEALENVQHHVQRLGGTLTSAGQVENCILPQLFEVDSIESVSAEIFGPVLQVVRFDGDPSLVIAQINALGYGLTLGIQTRIDSRANALAQAAQIGNIYVNRNVIGAVVGVQPFGGDGLSGTGPKAGGPHYLYRFCTEQTVTINTTAAGGNASLLAG
jgi:RHH-type transcriptional regulator, proline utilization regulon repressor / proline dehydrogenase / delta 1-pyrroline-5-carboxylate dehydrogenase